MNYLLALLLVCQQPAPLPPVPDSVLANSTTGLSLPADFSVPSSEGFVEIEATTTGEARFYVLGTTPVKFRSLGKSIIVATPAQGGQVVILAIAQVDGKLTEFARCNLTVTAVSPTPTPPPSPTPTPTPIPVVTGKLFVTVVEDPSQRTQAIARVIDSQALRDTIGTNQGKGFIRVVANNDPFLKDKNLITAVQQAGPLPIMIIQDELGKIVYNKPLPTTEADAVNLVKQLRGVP